MVNVTDASGFAGVTDGADPDDGPAGTITLLVSHRFATVRMADVIVYLEAATRSRPARHDELMAANGRYAELFTLQAAEATTNARGMSLGPLPSCLYAYLTSS